MIDLTFLLSLEHHHVIAVFPAGYGAIQYRNAIIFWVWGNRQARLFSFLFFLLYPVMRLLPHTGSCLLCNCGVIALVKLTAVLEDLIPTATVIIRRMQFTPRPTSRIH